MRDIRPDLQERLTAVEKALKDIAEKYKLYTAEREAMRSALAAENQRWSGVSSQSDQPGNGNAPDEATGTALSLILKEQLSDHKRHHLSDLSAAATSRGYPFGEKKPGRVVHFALLAMREAHGVEQVGDGFWRLKNQS